MVVFPLTILALLTIPALAREIAVPIETLRVAGLHAPAEIRVDRWGVPHIYAKSEADVFFAQGFNAARDRLFQIDLWRRRGLGQLAEVFGPEFVDQDRAARLFLYRGDMDREWRIYSSRNTRDAEPVARRFVEGINAYVDWLQANPARMPWEFKFLDYAPAKWTADDVIRIRSHGLTRNLNSEVARANTLCKAKDVDADQIRFGLTNDWKAQVPDGLDPCLPGEVLKVFQLATQGVRVTKSLASATRTSVVVEPAQVAMLEEAAPEGSNSWVVAPGKSATGRPIMANDPHRGYSAPSLRYLVHLSAPGLDVVGAGEPALPGISLGHNGTIAFGLTIFNIDQEDLYVYELNPADASQYKYGNGWEPLRSVNETIAVRGAPAKTVELAFTRHGPVIHVDPVKGRAYAVRSGWLEAGMSPYFGSLEYMRAKDFDAFRKSLVNWGAPTLNQVYADKKGNIGWIPSGLAPKRANWDGLLPVPGDGRYEWSGFWRGDQMPAIHNPNKGWIATANAYNIPDGYPARERKLGFEWTNPSRHQRVHEVLGGLSKVSLEDSQRLQNDITSIPARRLVALLAPLASDDEKTKRALALLRGWDARQHADSPQAALQEIWQLRHLRKGFREAVLKPEAAAALQVSDMNVMLSSLEKPEERFGDNAAAKRDQLLLTTLKSAWEEMEKLQGPEPAMWQWGKFHHNLNEHAFAPVVDDSLRVRINVGPIAKHGSEYTPNQSLVRASDFRQTNGPSVRLVVDVGNWDNSRAINHPGQSGDPDNPHYRDLAPLWRNGEYFPLAYSRKAVERVTERVIRLMPAR
ncbi:MAG TPA: penicillin acylase family protein [Casimicrobiaceae bacterium]|nr:penicillin acylase family protein [Casimicrobiaceae bacterium]